MNIFIDSHNISMNQISSLSPCIIPVEWSSTTTKFWSLSENKLKRSLSGQIGWPGNIWFETQGQYIFFLYVYKPTDKQQKRRVATSFNCCIFLPQSFPSCWVTINQGRNRSEKAKRILWASVETCFHVKTGLEKIFPKRALSVVV